jgi:hypothetical protein
LPNGQVHPFHKRRVQPSAQAQLSERRLQSLGRAAAHHARHAHDLAVPIGLLDLTIDQLGRDPPLAYPLANCHNPPTEVGAQGIEVQIQAITCKNRDATWSKALTEFVDNSMRGALCPRTKVQDRDEFRQWVHRHPEPEHVRSIAQSRAQFIKLQMRELEAMEPVVMQARAVLPGSREPGGDRRMPMAEDAHRGGDTEPFRQGRQHLRDSLGGGFEAVERRVAAGAEGCFTRLTTECLDALPLPMHPVADEGMDLGVRNMIVVTGW